MVYTLPRMTAIVVRQDWDNDGNFAGTYDDVSADTLPGVSIELGRDQGRVTGGPMVPKASWTLLNESRRYATEYSGSPLHGKLQPGHLCQISRFVGDDLVAMNATDTAMDSSDALMAGYSQPSIFTGRTDTPTEHYQLGQRTVDVPAYGMIQRLVNTLITYTNAGLLTLTTGQAMVEVLTAAGLSAADWVIDQDAIDNGYSLRHFYVDNEPAWDVCKRIWATSGPPSALYEDAYGKIHFEGRNYRTITTRCLTVQQTFSDLSSRLYFTDLEYEPSYLSVINDMTIDVEQRAAQQAGKVWEYGSSVTITNSATVDLIANVSDPLIALQTPVVTTDFLISFGSLTSVTLTQLSPLTYRIRLVAGGSGAVVTGITGNTGIQLQAEAVPVVSRNRVTGTFDVAPSQAAYGKHKPPDEISGAIWKDISEAHAAAIVDGYLVAYQAPRAIARVVLENATGALLYEMLSRQISDRIHVADSWSGVSLDMTIEKIQHEITTDNLHRVTFHCERVVELGWARWDVGRWDVDKWGQ